MTRATRRERPALVPCALLVEKCGDRWATLADLAVTMLPYVPGAPCARLYREETERARRKRAAAAWEGPGRPRPAAIDVDLSDIDALPPADRVLRGLARLIQWTLTNLMRWQPGVVRKRDRRPAEYYLSRAAWARREARRAARAKNPKNPGGHRAG